MIGCAVYDGQANEFSTVEVAEILEVSRLNFYEWTCRKYVQPIRVSKRRGNAAVFDMAGLMAAAIFSRLKQNIRRPIAGKISRWYQEHGATLLGDMLYCAINNSTVTMHDTFTAENVWFRSECSIAAPSGSVRSDYVIAIPIGSIRQWIKTRVKEIRANGHPGDQRGEAP